METTTPDAPTAALPQAMSTLLADADAISFHADLIRVNGYTVIEDALPVSFIEEMRERFDTLLEEYRNSVPTNRGANRYQMFLPFEPPFSSTLLCEHPVVLAIVKEVLGSHSHIGYLASDTPFPGSDYQAVHPDSAPLFPEVNLSLPSFALVFNVPLVDVTEENGPLEIWPGGTHLISDKVNIGKLAPSMVAQRLTMKAGGILLRDPRVWHRGTPNNGARSRPNVALVYARPWYRFGLDGPTLKQSDLEALSDQGKALFRFAKIVEG